MASFDPYHKWLGIPPQEQPPDHYQLLALSPFERNPDVIDNAANVRQGYLKGFLSGEQRREAKRLLREVEAARRCLLNPARKGAYDAQLRGRYGPPPPQAGAKPVTALPEPPPGPQAPAPPVPPAERGTEPGEERPAPREAPVGPRVIAPHMRRRRAPTSSQIWGWSIAGSVAAVALLLWLVLASRRSPPGDGVGQPSQVATKKTDQGGKSHPVNPPRPARRLARGLATEIYRGENFDEKLADRVDPQVDFYWGEQPAGADLPADHFSIRWTGWLRAPVPGRYRFNVISDDGVRLWLDGRALVDDWHAHAYTPHEFEVELTGGAHELKIEHFERTGPAMLSLQWELSRVIALQAVPPEVLFRDRDSAERAEVGPASLRGPPDSASLVLSAASRCGGLVETAVGQPIDLLRMADPHQGAVRSEWYFRGKALASAIDGPALVQISCEPPEEYELSMDVERVYGGDALILSLPVGGRPVSVVLDGYPPNHRSGLDLVDLRRYGENDSTHLGQVIPPGKRTRVTAIVKRASLEVRCGDMSVISWTGDPWRLSRLWQWRLGSPRLLGLGAWHTVFAVHGLQLTPLSGRRQPWPEPQTAATAGAPISPSVRKAAAALLGRPADARANETFGRWLCLERGHWPSGLVCLARASQGPWKRLAEQELAAAPGDAAAALAVADGWWDQSLSAAGRTKRALMRHAAQWYELARPRLHAQKTQQVDARLAEVDGLRGGAVQGAPLPQPAAIPADQWVDLLAAVDLDRDHVYGEWVKGEDGIRSPDVNEARLMFPLAVQGSYQLEAEFTRELGSDCLSLLLPVGHACGQVVLGGWGGNRSALIRIDGRDVNGNPTAKELAIAPGEPYRLLADVQVTGDRAVIDARLNDEPQFHWEGEAASLAPHPWWTLPELQRPAIGANSSVFRIHRARFRLVSGSAVWAEPGSGSPYQLALPMGGLGGTPFFDIAPPGSRLIGFRHGCAKALVSLQPLWRTPDGVAAGRRHGWDRKPDQDEQAKDGYAVGAVVLKTTGVVEGLRLVYYRDRGARLDPSDRYEGPWIGSRGGGPEITLHGAGRPIVGVHGASGGRVDSLGLVFSRSGAAEPQQRTLRLVDASPLWAHVGHGRYRVNAPAEFDSWPHIQTGLRDCRELIYAHAPSRLVYPLSAEARSFTAIGHCLRSGSVSFQVAVDGEQVYASERAGLVPVRVDLPTGGKELELIVDPLGGNGFDHSFWLLPRLHPVPVAEVAELDGREPHVKLTRQQPASASTSPGIPMRVDGSPEAYWPAQDVQCRPCSEYLYAHAPSHLVFAVPEGVREFSAIAYCTRSQSVKFRVFADGELLLATERAGIVPIRVPWPPGARRLALVVDPLRNQGYDHAYWCYARLGY